MQPGRGRYRDTAADAAEGSGAFLIRIERVDSTAGLDCRFAARAVGDASHRFATLLRYLRRIQSSAAQREHFLGNIAEFQQHDSAPWLLIACSP